MSEDERFRALIRNLRVGVIVQGANSEILVSNPAARELLGLTEDQLLGRTSHDPSWQITREDGTPFPPSERPVATVVATRRSVANVVMRISRPATHDSVWLMVSAEPEFAPDGSVNQVVATLVDVSDRKRLEESLLQSQKLESIGRLAGGVAHDFNNMLTVISGCLELSLQKLASDSALRKDLTAGLNAALRASALTKQLLIFARKQSVSPRMVSVQDSLRNVSELIGRLLSDSIDFSLHTSHDLWPVWIDPTQLEQVILNLCVNARDAMPTGGKLSVDAANVVLDESGEGRKGAYVRIRVSDTGEGMTEETRRHIFEPFFTTKAAGTGTGLGLSTVHGIVQQQGGYVSVETAPGVGSTFAVYLPSMHRASVRETRGPTLKTSWVGDETILLAEDDGQVRAIAASILRACGYQVLEASDGIDALEVARSHLGAIHLLLSDIVMPRLDGRALAEQLRTERPFTRVLLVSGYAEGAPNSGSWPVLAKPYRVEELAREVRRALDEN